MARTEKKNVLDLETRNTIYSLVSKNPGSHIRELERKSTIPYSSLKYHLHFLTKHTLITEKKENNTSRYFPKHISHEDIPILSLLRQKNIRRILILLLTTKKCTTKDIESFTTLSPATVHWYMEKLAKQQLIEKRKKGMYVTYTLTYNPEKLTQLLITHQKSFLDILVDRVIATWGQ